MPFLRFGFDSQLLRIMIDNINQTIISTPFPYAYSIPHLGNITQAIKGDLYTKIRNALEKNGWIKGKSTFCYSFHATGLPVYFRILELKNLLKSNVKESNLDISSFKKDIQKYFKQKNIVPLLKYVKKVKHCTTLKGWIECISSYYNDLFLELNISTNLPKFHTTTDLDKRYSQFVTKLYQELDKKGLIIEDENPLICCDSCLGVLGDHDRVKEEGIGISHHVVYKKEDLMGTWYSLKSSTNTWVNCGSSIFISTELIQKIKEGIPCGSQILFYDQQNKKFLINETFSKEVLFNLNSESKVYTTSAGITCRCGGHSTIKKEKTLFINFSNPSWKEKGRLSIECSDLPESSKRTLLNTLNNLRDVAFLRSFGYGTKLKFLPVKYSNKVVDSLMDSALHPYFYAYFLDPSLEVENLGILKNYKFLVHLTGKDLLPTHLLYMHLFSSMLTPQVKVPYFETTRFICASNKEKMSKSLNNVIYWSDIKPFCNPSGLKSYIANLADTDEATGYDQNTLIIAEKNIHKHKNILMLLSESKLNSTSLPFVKEVVQEILLNVGEGERSSFKLRRVYYLLFHKLTKILKETSVEEKIISEELIQTKTLIKDLINAFY